MTKKDYAGLAANILMLVGGAENISFCEHCMTRLRFNVKDRSLVRDEELNEEQIKELGLVPGKDKEY